MPRQNRPTSPLREPYTALKNAAASDLKGETTSQMLMNLVDISLRFLEKECIVVDLTSSVSGKRYFSFARRDEPDALSRAVNPDLFNPNAALGDSVLQSKPKAQIDCGN